MCLALRAFRRNQVWGARERRPEQGPLLQCNITASVAYNVDKRDPQFEEDDDVQMMVTELDDGDVCKTWKYFTIRAREKNIYGRWVYQLNDRETGEKYEGNTWFSEGVLKYA